MSYPTPQDAFDATAKRIGGTFVKSWTYPNGAITARFLMPDGGKQFRPYHAADGGGWADGDPPGLWPLYRSSNLARFPAEAVYLPEGEGKGDALAVVGLLAVAAAHGANSAAKTDWTPLAGRDVVILPDNDKPGRAFAEIVAGILTALDPPARVKTVALPGLPPKGDILDWIAPDGYAADRTPAEIKAMILALTAKAPPWTPADAPPAPVSLGALLAARTQLRPAVVHGLLREGETLNIIAPSKAGKTCLANELVLTLATGRRFLGLYDCEPGDVLILDNELHSETSADRLRRAVEALGIPLAEVADRVFVVNLRGRLMDIYGLRDFLSNVPPGRYKVIVLDAWYRFLPPKSDENDNSTMTTMYNIVDNLADRLKCCFVLIHHASKGNQSGKAIVDVGAGAGAQARAADTHMILRAHEEPDCFVLEAAPRTWPKVPPTCLRWKFPVFTPAPELDPALLKPDYQRRPKKEKEPAAPVKAWTTADFVRDFLTPTPKPRAAILEAARTAGLSDNKAKQLLAAAVGNGLAFKWPGGFHKPDGFATIPQPTLGDAQ